MNFSQLQDSIDGLLKKAGLGADLQSVLRGAGLALIIQVVAAGLSYASQVLLARVLGTKEFGVYIFAWSWTLPIATAAAIGLSTAVVRFVPEYITQDRWGHLSGLIRRSMSLVLAGGVAAAVLALLILHLLADRLAEVYFSATQIALICVPFATVTVLLSGVSRGFGWVGHAFVPERILIPAALILGTLIHVVFIGVPSASNILIWVAVGCAVIALAQTLSFRSAVPKKIRTAEPIYETGSWLRVAIPLFLADGIFLVLWNSDTVMLGAFMQPQDVSVYHAATRTAALTYLIHNAVRSFAEPKFAAIYARQQLAETQKFARSISSWMFWSSLVAVVGIAVLGKFILSLFGAEFLVGYPVLLFLCGGWLATMVVGPVDAYLAMTGHQDDVLYIHTACAVLNIIFNLVLIPTYGVMGAAVATVLARIISQAVFYIAVRRRLGIDAFFLSRS
jgi:O-antigen/teichoic acid export membrane protein